MSIIESACVVGSEGSIGSAVCDRLLDLGVGQLIRMDQAGPIALDVSDEQSVKRAFGEARAQLPRCGALVIASGVLDLGKLATLELASWNRVLAINLTGPFLCCRQAQSWIRDGGRIVLIGSLAGRTGGVLTGTAYSVSKGGLESLTKSIAQELSPRRITVNCIAPGAVDTAMLAQNPPQAIEAMRAATPLRRLAQANEIAAAVAYLLSADAGFITGTTLAINGGIRMD